MPEGLARLDPANTKSVPSVTVPPLLLKLNCCAAVVDASMMENTTSRSLVAMVLLVTIDRHV
ncbi:MAG: hypothetical protein ACLP59_08730 [Bryobacteraceae bacterium]